MKHTHRTFRKLIALLMAISMICSLAVTAWAEGDTNSSEATFEADPLTPGTGEDAGTVTVTDDAALGEDVTDQTIPDQSVSVQFPVDDALTEDPAGDVTVSDDAVEYNTAEGSETVPVTEEFDLTAEITEVEMDGEGNLTDITYDVSLDQQTTVDGTAQDSVQVGEGTFDVTLSINGMDDPTRVEHDLGDGTKEYFYNEANGTEDTTKKYFTVIQNLFVSLKTSILGTFHITNDAFENQKDMTTSSNLADAVNSAGNGDTVEMLRDYESSTSAYLTNSSDHGNNITVDFNDHTYKYEMVNDWAPINVAGTSQTVSFENGTIQSTGDGIHILGNQNTVSITDFTLNTDCDTVYTYSAGSKVSISDATINTKSIGVWDVGKKNSYTIDNSNIYFSGSFGIYHNGSDGGASFTVTDTIIDPGKTGAVGIYISGSSKKAAATDTDGLNSLILNGGTLSGYQSAVEVKFTDVTIDGSTLKGLGVPPEHIDNSSGTTTTGAALAVTDNSDGKTGGTILITSGNFYGAKDFSCIYQSVKETTGDDKATITLQGGRYVYPDELRNYINTSTHGLISYNDGSEFPYAVIAMNATPTRPGYVFQGYLDENGSPITLAQANATKAIAYAQWALAVAEEEPSVSTPEAPKDNVIIVEPDSQGNNVDIAIQGGTAQVTVSTPTGDAAAVSEVTITSVQELQSQGVDTVTVQIEENVTLELGVAQGTDNGLGDSIAITREADTLVISSGEDSKITIHMDELKEAAAEPLHIRYDEGVVTISFGSKVVFRVEVLDALKTNSDLVVKLENGVLKLYDKQGTLLQEISM